MGKATTVFVFFALIFSVSLARAIRPNPERKNGSVEAADGERGEVGCDGVGEEEEECLMRRTLVAHTDYIYTQGKPRD